MMPKRATLASCTALAAVLAGCGDDLESRNAAIENAGPPGGGEREMVLTPGRQGEDRRNAETRPADNGFAGQRDDDEGERVVDAEPDDLIDAAEGFDPTPMDDASGIGTDPMAEDDWAETD